MDGGVTQEIKQIAFMLGPTAIIQTWKETQLAVSTMLFTKNRGFGCEAPPPQNSQVSCWELGSGVEPHLASPSEGDGGVVRG